MQATGVSVSDLAIFTRFWIKSEWGGKNVSELTEQSIHTKDALLLLLLSFFLFPDSYIYLTVSSLLKEKTHPFPSFIRQVAFF